MALSLPSLVLTACGLGASAPPTLQPTVAATVAPTATRAAVAVTASPEPKATSTPEPRKSDTVWVGNTDGEGVYVRNTPLMSDRAQAYADGTPLTIIGDDVDGDNQHWKHVRAPDGLEGYVPAIYTVHTAPE